MPGDKDIYELAAAKGRARGGVDAVRHQEKRAAQRGAVRGGPRTPPSLLRPFCFLLASFLRPFCFPFAWGPLVAVGPVCGLGLGDPI